MGMDQYVYKVKGEPYRNWKGLCYPEETRIQDWCDRYDIQNWMTQLFHKKGGQGEFNCDKVWLEEEDLLWLLDAIVGDKLPSTWWQEKEYYEEEKDDDSRFIDEALTALAEGYKLYYTSWW